MASFDLNLLRVLDALLREGSTVRAGERLGLSQPAVSAALGRLRAALGDELFFRRGQELEPTEFARSLAVPLRAALDGIETMLNGPDSFDPARSAMRYRISGSDFFAEMLMPRLAERLSVLAPGMKLHLVDLLHDSHIANLERYAVDLALLPSLELPHWAQARRAFSSDYAVIARRGHPRLAGIAQGGVVPVDLFCELGHVLFSPEGKARAAGDVALAAIGRRRRVVMTMPVFSGVYRAVAGSDLIALLPSALARHVAQGAGIETYRAPVDVGRVDILMVWHRRHAANPAHLWLRRQIAAILAPLDTGA